MTKKKIKNNLIIFIDKRGKRAIAYEGGKDLEASIIGSRHPKYRWKLSDLNINKEGAIIEFDKDDIEEREKMIKAISKKLKDQINIEEFLKDKLEDEHFDNIKDIYERLAKKKAKVTNKEGCFYLNIGGKRGKPKKLILSE